MDPLYLLIGVAVAVLVLFDSGGRSSFGWTATLAISVATLITWPAHVALYLFHLAFLRLARRRS